MAASGPHLLQDAAIGCRTPGIAPLWGKGIWDGFWDDLRSKSKYPPAEPEALVTVSRSKRLGGGANATPRV